MNTPVIELKHVSKSYSIHHEKPTLVEKFIKGRDETFLALDDISITINKGDAIGLIGLNGSGKTTLLKLIAGITTPTSGRVLTSGKIVSLIDLEAGFHPDLTGFQNIYLNGIIIGMTKKQIDVQIGNIISYADIHQFIDVPLFTYSNGMRLHVGFSVAIHANPDILLLDEGLNVGDEYFFRKAGKTIRSLNKKGATVIVSTHDPITLHRLCKKIVVMHHGKILKQGGMDLITQYENGSLLLP
jgi:ABC-type polysaccharide/polyol phosphate transport system ATPase subunit